MFAAAMNNVTTPYFFLTARSLNRSVPLSKILLETASDEMLTCNMTIIAIINLVSDVVSVVKGCYE